MKKLYNVSTTLCNHFVGQSTGKCEFICVKFKIQLIKTNSKMQRVLIITCQNERSISIYNIPQKRLETHTKHSIWIFQSKLIHHINTFCKLHLIKIKCNLTFHALYSILKLKKSDLQHLKMLTGLIDTSFNKSMPLPISILTNQIYNFKVSFPSTSSLLTWNFSL